VGSAGTLVDTGPLFAVADVTDAHHTRCGDALAAAPRPLVVPVLVVTEAAYLIGRDLGATAEVRFLAALAHGEVVVEDVAPGDWLRIAELVSRYRDLPLGTVDASIVAAGERLRITRVMTLDRRHFGIVRPRHVDLFDIVPV